VSSIDSKLVLLTCADERQARRLLEHGSRRAPALARVPTVALPTLPERADIDPVLAERDPRRVIVAGSDAALAAVLVRLLRTERLDVELAFLPSGRSAAADVWGLPKDAAALALDGTATPVPLVRDDAGGVLVGRGEIRNMHGECYCDETLVLRGSAPRLVVAPNPGGIAVRAGRTGKLPDGLTRAVPPTAPAGRGSALGRAVQLGGESMTVVHDGVEHPRSVPRWTWYRHTADWLLVRPA
jgi:hypothetical protein